MKELFDFGLGNMRLEDEEDEEMDIVDLPDIQFQ